ncbi:MAG: transposase [Planctomycetota bacterium]|nr:transposase [Planctomycetota bacterium]
MIRDAPVPKDADVTVLYDSAFDTDYIHRECRNRGFREIFPIDPNRNLATTDSPHALAQPGRRVVASTLDWQEDEFETLELEVENEDLALFRRRHVDNLRVKKTFRRYVIAARRANVSKLGSCSIVASYKENPRVELLEGQSDDWRDYRRAIAKDRKKAKKKPSRWHGMVLACTDPTLTAREVVEWYEIRWQIELFFRELKSRLQMRCYVLMRFEAVERYLDLLLMGFLLLEKRRLDDLSSSGQWPKKGDAKAHWRTTDRLRALEAWVQRFNLEYVSKRLQSKRGQAELLRKLSEAPCLVA